MKLKRIFSFILCAAMLIVLLSGCGGGTEPASTPGESSIHSSQTDNGNPTLDTDSVNTALEYAEKWETEFFNHVEQRKAEILGYNESLTCPGTAYYISNNGNDKNDGLSPDTAWASIEKMNAAPLRAGDVVYLERGSLWRGYIICPDGVSVSAYGEGEKPKLYGSVENGTGAEKWTLYYDENGVKIWQYHRTMNESGGIVLGDFETVARRVYSWYDGTSFYDTYNTTKPFDMVTALSKDLTFYCDIPMEQAELPFFPGDRTSTLYLRCDNGNPGELYPSIEFMNSGKQDSDWTLINMGDGCTIDNLCLMFFPDTAIELLSDNATVQNCEIAYGGGAILWFMEPEGESGTGLWTNGQAIFFQGSGETVRRNYIHDIDGKAVNFEVCRDYETTAAQIPYSDNIITDNLLEGCSEAVYVCNNVMEDGQVFDGLLIADNLFVYAEPAWHEGNLSNIYPDGVYFALSFNGGCPNFGGETICVENNVFYRAKGYLIERCLKESHEYPETTPQYSGNVFAQAPGEMLIMADPHHFKDKNIQATSRDETQKKIDEELPGAGEAIVLRLKN